MSKTYRVNGVRGLQSLFGRHQREREQRLHAAAMAAAEAGVGIVKRRVPVAHGELRESVRAEARQRGAAIVVDAPHAAPVETGSRPHMPPLAPLLAWVRLRGAQGLLTPRQVGRLPGMTTTESAHSVAAALRAMERGGSLDVDAPLRIARAIQHAIATRGTRPHWYARGSLPAVRAAVAAAMTEAFRNAP